MKKIAVDTGATRIIGKAAALRLAREGFDVVITGWYADLRAGFLEEPGDRVPVVHRGADSVRIRIAGQEGRAGSDRHPEPSRCHERVVGGALVGDGQRLSRAAGRPGDPGGHHHGRRTSLLRRDGPQGTRHGGRGGFAVRAERRDAGHGACHRGLRRPGDCSGERSCRHRRFRARPVCNVIIASTQAKFVDSYARVGILAGSGLSVRLPRLIGISRAKELSFTGNALAAEQAYEWGLGNRVVESSELLPACESLARQMSDCAPEVLRRCKALIGSGYGKHFQDALHEETAIAIESAKRTSAVTISSRREGVLDRNRAQSERGVP